MSISESPFVLLGEGAKGESPLCADAPPPPPPSKPARPAIGTEKSVAPCLVDRSMCVCGAFLKTPYCTHYRTKTQNSFTHSQAERERQSTEREDFVAQKRVAQKRQSVLRAKTRQDSCRPKDFEIGILQLYACMRYTDRAARSVSGMLGSVHR